MPPAAMPLDWEKATTVDRLIVEDEAQRVGIMHGDVHDDTGAGAGRRDTPALQVRRQIDRVEHAREQRPADPALLDRGTERAVGRSVAQMVVGSHDDAGRLAGVDHAPCVGEIQRERLLAKHVLAGRGRGERLLNNGSSLVVEM